MLKVSRQNAFYTAGFAQKPNVALSTVNRWELHKVKPNMKKLKEFCDEYGWTAKA